MPQLDVSDAILDPEFAEQINVTRRPYVINPANGETVVTPCKQFPVGVVTQGSPNEFKQAQDAQEAKSIITVHAYQFRFYDPVTIEKTGAQYQPDLIRYDGNTYIVDRVLNWSRYGQGFTQCEASLYQMTETPKGPC